MSRYYSHTIILPDETRLDDFVVEINGGKVVYFPFAGEIHSTIYIEHPILVSHRADLQGKTVSLDQLSWALTGGEGHDMLYAYSLMPCPACTEGRFTMTRL
jgi:hypothetical protein